VQDSMTSSNISMLMDQVLLEISRLSGNIEDICGETSMVYDNEIQGVQEFAEDLSCKVHVLEKRLARFEKYIKELQDQR